MYCNKMLLRNTSDDNLDLLHLVARISSDEHVEESCGKLRWCYAWRVIVFSMFEQLSKFGVVGENECLIKLQKGRHKL